MMNVVLSIVCHTARFVSVLDIHSRIVSVLVYAVCTTFQHSTTRLVVILSLSLTYRTTSSALMNDVLE